MIPRLADGAHVHAAQESLTATEVALTELANTYWVGATRVPPPRLAPLPAQPPGHVESDGRGAADVLAWDKMTGGPLNELVRRWYSVHAHAELEVLLRPESYSLVVGAHKVNLCDTGEGLTQVLPVLVAAALAKQDLAEDTPAYVVVEQPELHLHPRVHASIAEYFSRIAALPDAPRMLVETHSENFMYGIQLEIALGNLPRDSVIMYWVRQEDGRSTATPILFDDDGRPDGWPRQVFTEDTELAKKLLAARAARPAR